MYGPDELNDGDPNTREPLDAFGPDPNQNRTVNCIHCGDTYSEHEVKFELRFNYGPLWWCRNPTCDGAGIGFDLLPQKETKP